METLEVRCLRCGRQLRGAESRRLRLGVVCRRAMPALAAQMDLEARGQLRLDFTAPENFLERVARLARGFKKHAPGPIAAFKAVRSQVK